MNIYIIKYNSTEKAYVVADTFAEAEEIWESEPGRFAIEEIMLLDEVTTYKND